MKNGVRFLLNLVPGAQVVGEIATDAWTDYRRDEQEDALRAEVEALAHASPEQVRAAVDEAVRYEAADQPPDVQGALTAYLTQIPATIRRSLRRPSDPTGTTVPAGLALSGPEDLAAFLPARPPRFKPGDRPLPGVDWVLEELVGVGGFGEVWKARHAHLKSKAPVALKFCLDAKAVAALRNEAGVLDRVMRHGRHPGIVPLLQTYLSAEPPCLEYEFVEGGDLAGLIRDLHARGRMTALTANAVLLHLADILAFAHEATPAIVHGDLKPANVLIRRAADGKLGLRVTDFGLGGLAAAQAAWNTSQLNRSRQELLTEAVRGAYTPLYASPDQMRRRPGEAADPRDDVHALGVIWYQLLTGDLEMLSVPSDWREQVEGLLGQQLIALLAASIAPKADKRPASAMALAAGVRAALQAGDEPLGLIAVELPPKPIEAAASQAMVQPPATLETVKPSGTVGQPVKHGGGPVGLEPVEPAVGKAPESPAALQQLREKIFVSRLIQVLGYHQAFFAHPGRLNELKSAIARDFPEEVGRWGGAFFLDEPMAVREVINRLSPQTLKQAAVDAVFKSALPVLSISGLLCAAALVLLFAGGLLRATATAPWNLRTGADMMLAGLFGFPLPAILLLGGFSMMKLGSWHLALLSSLLMTIIGVATLPVGAGLVVLPCGIAAMRVLFRPEVRSLFPSQTATVWRWSFIGLTGAGMLMVCLGAVLARGLM
jgi:serine/threonine protein kinase